MDWFPGSRVDVTEQRAVCMSCLVRDECLAWALNQSEMLEGCVVGNHEGPTASNPAGAADVGGLIPNDRYRLRTSRTSRGPSSAAGGMWSSGHAIVDHGQVLVEVCTDSSRRGYRPTRPTGARLALL
jgi:hypothetical protein